MIILFQYGLIDGLKKNIRFPVPKEAIKMNFPHWDVLLTRLNDQIIFYYVFIRFL